MRRLIAILLLLIPGLPVVSPLMAAAAGRDAALPACCRRNGAHHCDNAAAAGNPSIPHIQSQQQQCPCYPGATVSTAQNGAATLAASPLFAGHSAPEALPLEQPFRFLSTLDRSQHERGPPSASLL